MLFVLNHRLEKTAKEIQNIQKAAYRIEAELMEFDGIPQLKESILEIQNAGEVFLGHTGIPLKGFISYKEESMIDIYRLAVDPAYFRQGIADTLLVALLEQFPDKEFQVSTGAVNEPAKSLYKKHGFKEEKKFAVAPGIWCINFIKSSEKGRSTKLK